MFREHCLEYIQELSDTLKHLDKNVMEKILNRINEAREKGNQVFVIGNGGSAAAASHWVCDFAKGINEGDSKRLKIFSLADNISISTALGNDISYDDIFVEQLMNYINEGDVVIGLSVSGKSANIVKSLDYTRKMRATTISITGDYDGIMDDISDITLKIPSKNYGIVEDVHMSVDHVISQYISKMNKKVI